MSKKFGTFTTVRDGSLYDFFLKTGTPKEWLDKMPGTTWTMNSWEDVDGKFGYSFECKEYPEFNQIDFYEVGVPKEIKNPFSEGHTKMTVQSTEDGFESVFESEACGKYTVKETYSDDGVEFVYTMGDDTFVDRWNRGSIWSGAYKAVKLENVEDFFSEFGEKFTENFKAYRAWFVEAENGGYRLVEEFGPLGKVTNVLTLNEETPFYAPGEDISVPTERRAKLLKVGPATFMMKMKNPDSSLEEWTITLGGDLLTLSGYKPGDGKKCSLELQKFQEMSGRFKRLAVKGFDEFAQAIGMQPELIDLIKNEKDMILEVENDGEKMKIKHTHAGHTIENEYLLSGDSESFHDLIKDTYKTHSTLKGNRIEYTGSSSAVETVGSSTFHDNFLVSTTSIPSKNIEYHFIGKRI